MGTGKIFFTSDHHFGHRRICEYANRPFKSTIEMDREMFRLWNETVGPDDLVYHLGDFAFASHTMILSLLQSLNGRKILVKGNHDRRCKGLAGPGMFEAVHEQLTTIEMGGRKVMLCHYPYLPSSEELEWAKANNYTMRYLERRPRDRGMVLLCGHIHNRWATKGRRMVNVGVDAHRGMPVSEAQVLAIIDGLTDDTVPVPPWDSAL